jgi:hypothetical protein
MRKVIFIVKFTFQGPGRCAEMGGMKATLSPRKEMMPTTSHVGPVLRRHRERLGLTLEVVAKAAGITTVALHRLETRQSSSKGDTYERVAVAMDLDYDLIVHEAALEARDDPDDL